MQISFIGITLAIIMLVPNLLIIILPPKDRKTFKTKFIIRIIEKIGQIGCIGSLVFLLNGYNTLEVNIFSVLIIICVLIYYYLWLRYALKGAKYELLLKEFLFIPIPMAVFTIAIFFFTGILTDSIYLIVFTVIFAIGHIYNSINMLRGLKGKEE